MNLVNTSGMICAASTAADAAAREHVVVVVKGTFRIPDDDGPVQLAQTADQDPLIAADTFSAAPGASSPILESDFALRKLRCDVLVNGTAYAEDARPTDRCTVGVKVGQWQKVFDVVGDRVWHKRLGSLAPSDPELFLEMPVSYDIAYGGIDDTDETRVSAYRSNPVGRGYGLERSGVNLVDRLVANTEHPRTPVLIPWGNYYPLSFGPVHRSWHPRLSYAGTYDQRWIDEIFPFLPSDFDDLHYQAAPEDQQIAEPEGGDEVVLANLTREGRASFRLPTDVHMPVVFFPQDGEPESTRAILDTLIIAPDVGKVHLVWRCTRPLKRNIFELNEVMIGAASRGWWRARRTGKTFYPSLDVLVRG